MEEQPILVLGATGTTGRRVAGRLRAAGTRSGPHALSFIEASRSSAGHRADRPLPGTAEDYLAAQTALGAPAEQTQPEIEAFFALRELGDARPTGVVRQVTGREPKDFERYAAEAAARGAWRG